jgi:hypothetical protein
MYVLDAVSFQKRGSWKYRRDEKARGGDDDNGFGEGGEGEEEYPERIQTQQLLDYILAANEDHYEMAENAVQPNIHIRSLLFLLRSSKYFAYA